MHSHVIRRWIWYDIHDDYEIHIYSLTQIWSCATWLHMLINGLFYIILDHPLPLDWIGPTTALNIVLPRIACLEHQQAIDDEP